ncbi:MAG: flagellar motor switch protein FliG, partial [Firmicutes bacterium]|nr:flagellar motor switch protein FliG [Bacillota bacterium]
GKLTSSLQVRPFDFARRLDATTLINIIQHEQPQTIALILSYLSSRQSAQILSALPQNIQADIVTRISKMGKTSPEHIREVEKILERRLSSIGVSDFNLIGGINTTVEILNAVDRGTEKYILEVLNEKDTVLVEEIKSRMFLFEDIIRLNRLTVQRVLKEIDNDDLVMALKGVKPAVSEFIYENLSKRMQEMIREEIAIRGPVRVRDVEEAQQKIVMIIRRLEEAGEISIVRDNEEELVG